MLCTPGCCNSSDEYSISILLSYFFKNICNHAMFQHHGVLQQTCNRTKTFRRCDYMLHYVALLCDCVLHSKNDHATFHACTNAKLFCFVIMQLCYIPIIPHSHIQFRLPSQLEQTTKIYISQASRRYCTLNARYIAL